MPEMHKLSPGVENTIDKLKQAFFAGDLNRISNLLDRLKQNSNNPFETAHYHYYKASYLTALGDLSSPELLKQVSELEALYHQLKSQKILAFLFIRKALIALHLCNFDLSKKYFLNALKTLEKLNLVETYEYALTQINL